MNKETVQKALQEANHALANDDAAVTDITRLITNHENGKRPYYIYDSASGAKLGMSQLPVFEKRLTAFGGDILAMFASYKGRDSKPKAEPAAPKVEKSKLVLETVDGGTTEVPVTVIHPSPLTDKEIMDLDLNPGNIAPLKASKRTFKKPTKPAGPTKGYESTTTKTDRHGNPTEKTITITEDGKVVKREVRKLDPKDLVDLNELVTQAAEHNMATFGEGH